jgi:F-box/leucine-rich repeat protein 2/20
MSHDDHKVFEFDFDEGFESSDKGKGTSDPLPIQQSLVTDAGDLFHSYLPFPSSGSYGAGRSMSHDDADGHPSVHEDTATQLVDKGKARELPPSLPPLEFSPTEFDYAQAVWPLASSTPGPSSYGSGFMSIPDTTPPSSLPNPNNEGSPTLRRVPSRRRSLSNLSVRSDHSATTRSVPRIKAKFGAGSSTLARKLLFRKRPTCSSTPSSPPDDGTSTGVHDVGCLLPWRADLKSRRETVHDIDHDLHTGPPSLSLCYAPCIPLSKPRSNSSPFPLSALDIIPATSHDVFAPIPIVIHNYFDTILPKELRLEILASLVRLHQQEFESNLREGRWTVAKATASKNKYVGRNRGIRELVKLSRVCQRRPLRRGQS